MPDIATALKTALETKLAKELNEWDDTPKQTPAPAPAPIEKGYHTVTNNVTRTTFNYIRDNAGKPREDVIDALIKQGFKHGSVTSLVAQMVKTRLVRDDMGGLYVNQQEYTPIRHFAPPPKRKQITITRRKPEGVTEPAQKTETVPLPPNVRFTATTTELLRTLNIVQARELYDELKKIFGG